MADTVGYTGVVRDIAGNPIEGACFALHSSPTDVVGEFCSDEQGRYVISGDPTGREYKIRIHADGFRTQWWYDEPNYLNAAAVSIPAWGLVQVDFTLGLGAGTIKGRVTDQTGAAADATVTVFGVDRFYDAFAYTWDLGDGRYEIDNLPLGRYRVSIYDNARGTQWVPQKENEQEATVFTVTDGAILMIDEQWLPLGVVEARVVDATNGRPVPRPCIYIHSVPQPRQACGSDGIVRVEEVPPGYWEVSISGGASYFPIEQGTYVEVTRREVARIEAELAPASAVVTSVVDAATGAPVSGVCVHLVAPKWGGQSAHMLQHCSDEQGRLEIGPYSGSATVQLYAFQARNPFITPDKLYGAQWVTEDGGTGDQRKALLVHMRDKQTVTIPSIKMDPPGAISGIIRNATTGAAVPGVCTYPYAFQPNQGAIFGRNCSNAEGRYTISDLGPYQWPVEFTTTRSSGLAWQWSGDVADRFSATMAQVTAGGTAEMDARLVVGGTLTGTVTDGAAPVDAGYVWTYNARTGDIASPSFVNINRDGTFTLGGHRTQRVYVEYWSLTDGCWYTADGPTATAVGLTAGATTTITADMTRTCAGHPGGPDLLANGSAGGPLVGPAPAGARR